VLCIGNSRLILGVSIALAGPVLALLKVESGGVNLVGDSSEGKTTVLHVARSTWGLAHQTWRNTANGLEGTAAALNDIFIALDELGMVDARDLGAMIYMLANGVSKARMTSGGGLREQVSWRALFLSTGEVTVAQKMATAAIKVMAGQEVRILDIEANAKAGLGVFENLHEHDRARPSQTS
jgi:putative DNA primase/helicase